MKPEIQTVDVLLSFYEDRDRSRPKDGCFGLGLLCCSVSNDHVIEWILMKWNLLGFLASTRYSPFTATLLFSYLFLEPTRPMPLSVLSSVTPLHRPPTRTSFGLAVSLLTSFSLDHTPGASILEIHLIGARWVLLNSPRMAVQWMNISCCMICPVKSSPPSPYMRPV